MGRRGKRFVGFIRGLAGLRCECAKKPGPLVAGLAAHGFYRPPGGVSPENFCGVAPSTGPIVALSLT